MAGQKKKGQKKKTRKKSVRKTTPTGLPPERQKAVVAEDQKVTAGQELEQPEEQEEAPPGLKLQDIIDGVDEEAMKTLAVSQTEETITIAPKVPEDTAIELTPEFERAVNVTMDVFEQFIIYERDKPEEGRLQIFPAYMHFKREDIDAEILVRYSTGMESQFKGSLEDLKLINWGIDDALSILKKRTSDTFPFPGTGPLNDLQFQALSEVAFVETAYFFRYSEEDLLRGYVQVSSRHAFSASSSVGSRFRTWLTVQQFAKKFIHVLSRENVDDMVAALLEDEDVIAIGYDAYILRWREAGLI